MKKLNYLFYLFVFALPILNINIASASSGACSYHGGVNCSAGADYDGSVICNDGWTDSSVSYSSMSSCQSSKTSCPMYLAQADYDKQKQEIQNAINKVQTENQTLCQGFLTTDEYRNEQTYQICVKSRQSIMNMAGSVSAGLYTNTTDCEDARAKQTEYNKAKYNSCLYNSQDTLFKYQTLLSCLAVDRTDYCKLKDPTTHTQGSSCVCNDGYQLNSTKTSCEPIPSAPANNIFAKSLSEALKNLPKEATTTKKVQVTEATPKPKSTTVSVSKSEKVIKVVATSTIISTTTPTTTNGTTTSQVVQSKQKTKWYNSFFSRLFGR